MTAAPRTLEEVESILKQALSPRDRTLAQHVATLKEDVARLEARSFAANRRLAALEQLAGRVAKR